MADEKDPLQKAVDGEPDKAAEAYRIAKELEEKLNNADAKEEPEPDIDPATLINTPDFKRKAKEATGMTDGQVDFVIRTANAASSTANENAAVLEVKSRHPDFAKFEKNIKEELKQYPTDKRGNAAIIEKLYYVERGKDSDKNSDKGNSNNRASIRGSGPTGNGLDNDRRNNSNSELSDEERYVARKMGIKEADYVKSKGTKLIHDLRE